ncbi:MAG: type II toxin-antitoxin system VapC family toxin [Caldilineales bacterium]|nr:type II toxin-antitoxin system VapC family toxin [Caldilineales bacterium]
MKAPVFIDTGYVLALLNTGDEHHDRATMAAQQVKPPFITTEAVLTEIGNALSRVRWRALGYATIQDLRADSNIEVVTVDAVLFDRASALYGDRLDKEWGLTDCISFVVMQDRKLTQAVITDRHFDQAGFVNLLQHLPAD